MTAWTGNLSDVGLGHLVGLNPVVEFHLNGPNMGFGGQVYATKPAASPVASSGAFTVDLVDTSAMVGDAWLEMHVKWQEPGTGTNGGFNPVDFHVKTPLYTNSTGGPISNALGKISNLAAVYISLTPPPIPLPGLLWWKTDPTNPANPANTGNIYRWENS